MVGKFLFLVFKRKIGLIHTQNVSTTGTNSNLKTILFWNEDEWFDKGQSFQTCSHTNCFITKNNSMLDDPNYIINAVVFRGEKIPINVLRKLKELKHNTELAKQNNRRIIPKIVLFMRVGSTLFFNYVSIHSLLTVITLYNSYSL